MCSNTMDDNRITPRIARLLKRYGKETSPLRWDFFVGNRTLIRYRMNRQITKLLELIDAVPKGEGGLYFLDVGCGTGRYLAQFLPRGATTGVDISLPMLQEAEKNTGGRATLIQADAESLPFKDQEFDVVTCSYLLENLNGPEDNPEKVLQEMYRVTKKGGQIIFTVETWYSMINLIGYILARLRRRRPLNFYDVKRVKKLTWGITPCVMKIRGVSPITVFSPWARFPKSLLGLIEAADNIFEKIFPHFGAQLIVEIRK